MYVYIYIHTHTEAETGTKKVRITHEYSSNNIANSSLGVHNTPYIRNKREKKRNKTTSRRIEDDIRCILSAMNDEI
jgi:hypothetical protein